MKFPCADPSGRCIALVATEGDKCSVHQLGQQGPYSTPCYRCAKEITEHDLFVRGRDQRTYHYGCRPGRDLPFKAPKAKKSWTLGLGLLGDER